MQKKQSIILALVLLIVLTLGLGTGVMSRYITTIKSENTTITVQSGEWNPDGITLSYEQALTLEIKDGVITVPEYFFVPTQTDAESGEQTEGQAAEETGEWKSVIGIGEGAFQDRKDFTEVELPDSIKSIGADAFRDSTMKSITLPASVTSLGDYALSCSNLTSIAVAQRNTVFRVSDGDLYFGTTLVRHIKTDTATWYTVPAGVTAIVPGAFSYSGYNAIVTTLYDSKVWGAYTTTNPAVIFDTQHLHDVSISGISVNESGDYTLELSGTIPANEVVYHLEHHPDGTVGENSTDNKKLSLTNNSGIIPAADCAPCAHENCVQITLSSYEKYAYGVLMTNGTLEIHNCYVTETEDGVIHQYKSGTHAHLTGSEAATAGVLGVYSLPGVTGSIPTDWKGVSAWSSIDKSKVTSVRVIDEITLGTNDSTADWFTGMNSAVTMDLEKLNGISAGTFSGLTGLKVVYYKGDITGAPWEATGALIVNNKLGVDLGFKSESNGDYTLSVPASYNYTHVAYQSAATGKMEYSEVSENNTFTIPAGDYGTNRCITLEPANRYAFGYLDKNVKWESSASKLKNVLKIHNCQGTISDGNLLCECGTGGSVTIPLSSIYKLPANALPDGVRAVDGADVKQWTDLKSAKVAEVEFVDAMTLTSMEGWFDGFENCMKIDLSKVTLSADASVKNLFAGCVALESLTLGEGFGAKGTNLNATDEGTGLAAVAAQWVKSGETLEDKNAIDASKIPMGTQGTYIAYVDYCYAIKTNNLNRLLIYQRKQVPKVGASVGDGSTVDLVFSWPGGSGVSSYTVTEGCRPPRGEDGVIRTNWNDTSTIGKNFFFSVYVEDNIRPQTLSHWFAEFGHLGDTSGNNKGDIHLAKLDTGAAVSMQAMFQGCTALDDTDFDGDNEAKFADFNTSNVTDMSSMFSGCNKLTALDLSAFNTEKVTTMASMFYDCSGLTSLDVSKFNTSLVTDMSSMFSGCNSLTALTLKTETNETFTTAGVTNMSSMFSGCGGLTSLDVSGFNTSGVTTMESMFSGCGGLTSLDVSKFDTSNVTTMGEMFRDCSNLKALTLIADDDTGPTFTFANVVLLNSMFNGCSALETLDLSRFTASKIINITSMFYNCEKLETVDLSKFKGSAVVGLHSTFYNCKNLCSLKLGSFTTTYSTQDTLKSMFYGCEKLKELDLSGFNVSKVHTGLNMAGTFTGCTLLERIVVTEDFSKAVQDARTKGDDTFSECISLVGGSGTTYDPSKVNHDYGRLDGHNGLRGYFTASDADAVKLATLTVTLAGDVATDCTTPGVVFVDEPYDVKLVNKNSELTRVKLSRNDQVAYASVGEDGTVTIPAEMVKSGAKINISPARVITTNLSHITAGTVTGYDSGEDVSVTLTPVAGYALPDTVTVKIDGAEVEATSYTFTKDETTGTGTISIGNDKLTDYSKIEIEAEGKQQVTVELSDLTGVKGPDVIPVPVPGEAYVIRFTLSEGYQAPVSATVKIGEADAETMENIWDETAGTCTITIPGDKVVENTAIQITVTATEIKNAAECTNDENCTAVEHSESCPKGNAGGGTEAVEDSCNNSDGCTDTTHGEGCPLYKTDEGGEPDAVEDTCTMKEGCAAESHNDDCPEKTNAVSETCTKLDDCTAATHETGCPKYVAEVNDLDAGDVTCTKGDSCPATTHVEGCPLYKSDEGGEDEGEKQESDSPDAAAVSEDPAALNDAAKPDATVPAGKAAEENDVFPEEEASEDV